MWDVKFLVAAGNFGIDLGRAKLVGDFKSKVECGDADRY